MVAENAPQAPQASNQIKVMMGGTPFYFPSDMPMEQIHSQLSAFKKSTSFDRLIDKKSGAPAMISAMVGPEGDRSPEDRLSTLKGYYPDAEPYGVDNFIFTDPGTGKYTLYNPEGFEVRDIAEYGRTVSEAVGSGLGAVAGFLGGGAVGLPSGPGALGTSIAGGVIGAGIGAEFGTTAFDVVTDLFTPRVDTKTVSDRMIEAGVRVPLAAAGEAFGPSIAVGVKRAFGAGTDYARNLADKFQALGIDPVAAAISEGKMLPRVEAGLEAMATSADDLYKQAERVVTQTKNALDNILSRIGIAREPIAAGEALKNAALSARQRIAIQFDAAYDEVFSNIDIGAPIESIKAAEGVVAPFLEKMATLPDAAQPNNAIKALARRIEAFGIMARNGELSFNDLRALRTEILADARKANISTPGSYDRLLNDVADALTDDLNRSAAELGGDAAADMLASVNKKYRIYKEGVAKTLQKIEETDADERAFEYVMASARSQGPEGIKAIQRLREVFTDDEWGDVVASVFHNLGKPNPSAPADEFSVSTFMTALNRIRKNGPQAMETLVGGTQYAGVAADLFKFIDVVDALKNVKRVGNVSQTAGAMHIMMVAQALGGTAVGLQTGDVGGGVAGLVGTILAPKAAAKLLTSPGFVNWIATPAGEAGKELTKHMAKLALIAKAEPYIAEEIKQFASAFRALPGYDKTTKQQGASQ